MFLKIITDLLGLIYGHDAIEETPKLERVIAFILILFCIIMLYLFGS